MRSPTALRCRRPWPWSSGGSAEGEPGGVVGRNGDGGEGEAVAGELMGDRLAVLGDEGEGVELGGNGEDEVEEGSGSVDAEFAVGGGGGEGGGYEEALIGAQVVAAESGGAPAGRQADADEDAGVPEVRADSLLAEAG